MSAVTQGVERGKLKTLGFTDAEMEFQLQRGLGAANYGGSSVGELLAAAQHIRSRSDSNEEAGGAAECWVQVHAQLAQQTEKLGREALAKGHSISARDHLLRASMYYRAAEYFCDPYQPDHTRWGLASRQAFILGAGQLGTPFRAVEIPYGDACIPAYFLQPDDSHPTPRKTIILNTGFDGCGEEMYFMGGLAGLERGYNVLLFDGPGQTGMTRLYPQLKFRPDWEVPIASVVDWLSAQPSVDMDRLALYGVSLGGYFATRAACFEPRIRALAVNSPILDLKAYQLGFFPPETVSAPPEVRLEWLPEIPRNELPDHLRSLLKMAFFRFGAESLHEWLAKLDDFQTGQYLKQIKIPCLSMVGAAEGANPHEQARAFCKGVSGPVTERVFGFDEGADTHCQVGNLVLSAAVLYDWLDEVFAQMAP